MIGSTRQVAVYVHVSPVDMRKSYDTLAALIVRDLKREVLSGDIYLFVGKSRRRAKALYWDGTGLVLVQKRLEIGRFVAPWACPTAAHLCWTMSELALFFEGSEVVGRMRLSPPIWKPGGVPAPA
ncbi:MAG: IS66 family insertion sequence element accessory protein TnpB [Myxococcota bacterium]